MLCVRRMQLSELPNLSAAVVVESAPLWVVWDMVNAGQYDLAVVVRANGAVWGVVRRDAIQRLAARVPEAPVKMVPMRRALEISSATALHDALALLGDDDIEALLLERPGTQTYSVLLRDQLEQAMEPMALAVG